MVLFIVVLLLLWLVFFFLKIDVEKVVKVRVKVVKKVVMV